MSKQPLDGMAMDGDVLGVHFVAAYVLALDGTERAGTDVQRHLFALNATGIDVLEHALREVQASRWSRHRTLYLRIDRLVGRLVALLGLSVQVGRDGQLADGIDDFGKGESQPPSNLPPRREAF